MRISDWSSDVCSSDLLEPAEPVAGRLRAAHGIEGIAPDAAAEGTRRALESKHFGDGGAVVGKAVDAGETRAEHLTLQPAPFRSEEHTSELQSLMRISYAVFCLKKKIQQCYPFPTSTRNHTPLHVQS